MNVHSEMKRDAIQRRTIADIAERSTESAKESERLMRLIEHSFRQHRVSGILDVVTALGVAGLAALGLFRLERISDHREFIVALFSATASGVVAGTLLIRARHKRLIQKLEDSRSDSDRADIRSGSAL